MSAAVTESQEQRVTIRSFKEQHTSLFTFGLELEAEIVNLRAVGQEKTGDIKMPLVERGVGVPGKDALRSTTSLVTHAPICALVYSDSHSVVLRR